MKSSPKRTALWMCSALLACSAAAGAVLEPGALPAFAHVSHSLTAWLQNAVAGSPVESAMYRMMQLPGGEIDFRRSPSEARPALAKLIASDPSDPALWSLRALEDEQALDFVAAERDWKTWVEKSPDKSAAYLDLANFYERRLRPQDELAALEAVGNAPSSVEERWTPAEDQRAWKAWERAVSVVQRYVLPQSVEEREYRAWEQRYPQEKAVYQREFHYLLGVGDFPAATDLIARYRAAFPKDQITLIQDEAQLAVRRGTPQDGIAVYDRSFQPLWPKQLVSTWFQLLVQSRQVHRISDELRAKVDANPDDLDSAARLFYLEQQQGRSGSAQQVLDNFRQRRDAAGGVWSNVELYTLAQLEERASNVPEAARYYYALAANRAASPGPALPGAELKGLAGLARLLLASPEQPLRVGAANLSLYRNIATMDRGPGYLNGILSLLLNTQSPRSELAQEDALAVPYYHRAKAAEIIAIIDKRFPQAPERADLHASLIQAYQTYGDDAAVIREGAAFLAQFPAAPQRVQIALATADAYAGTGQTDKEFAVYQSLLTELAARAHGVPMRSAEQQWSGASDESQIAQPDASAVALSQEYARVLNRYLSRLASMHRLPEALAVLRGQLDRNPDDPGLYQRLAQFLEQNSLNDHVEAVYQRAMQQFQTESWYAKLARFYLRQKRAADYAALSRKAAGIFSGTQLEAYLQEAPAPDWRLGLEVDLYAHQRFPHDLTFVNDLLGDYERAKQSDEVMKLLWQNWDKSPELRDRLFEALSSTGQLDAVLTTLKQQSPQIGTAQWTALAQSNPAAERFWVETCLWQSHFEQAVGAADALSNEYPADEELGNEAASLYRSFAYFHPEDTDKAVAIENRLLSANPGDLDIMARIGDIYADRGRMADADPYWVRMAEVHPGDANGYLQSATVFWDYFDFSHALGELQMARQRLHSPTLFGYQAGAIEESEGNATAAIPYYVASALATNSSGESLGRLLYLAGKPALQQIIESDTAGLLSGPSPTPAAISLRVSILGAENRRDVMAQELQALAAKTQSFDVLNAIVSSAQNESLPQVQEVALRRQIALTTDPARSLQLRYQLVDFFVSENQNASASAEIDAIDHEHPKILGVVRATVDYDWDHGRRPQAVAVLLNAAQAAYPSLKQDFQLEAASKLTTLGNYKQANSLLEGLLAASPLDARFAAAMAENYARSGDQAGLETFYRGQINAVKASSLDAADKLQRIAQMRRGMIVAATALGNFSDAVDQYIELINAFPDDADLTQEAALYAIAHQQRDRLFAFYQKTIQVSPRDPRWSIVLARLATAGEDFPTAIAAYGKAIALRPARQDLLIAQADLNERLQRFDGAVADYQKLYALSYHDPQWMQKVAEARARQGRTADAVQALQTAWIAGYPVKAANDFHVASQLESWGMLDEAHQFAEQGMKLAGADLLVNGSDQSGAATWARIMVRLRQTDAAYARLVTARQQAGGVSIVSAAQHAVAGEFAGVSPQEWLEQRQKQREQAAQAGFVQALRAMGEAVARYDTPQEKAQFAARLRAKSRGANSTELRDTFLPLAQAAKLPGAEADLRWQLIENEHGLKQDDLNAWIDLEARRVQLDGAGKKIADLAVGLTPSQQPVIWRVAADVYRRSGDSAGELLMLEHLADADVLSRDEQTRFYGLLLAHDPQKLIRLSTSDSAAQFLVVHGSAAQALAAVSARAAGLPPVWSKAYTALTGLYRGEHSPAVTQDFVGALRAGATIGERIAHPVDRTQQLAGSVWFYYGSRYGVYLDEQKDPQASDYLVSGLEAAPGNPKTYSDLADYSAKAGRYQDALMDYQHSLDLKADQPAVLGFMATTDMKLGRASDAIAAWQAAVTLLAKEMDAQPVPPSFWGDTTLVLRDCSAAGKYDVIRQPVDAMIRAYLKRNGTYLSDSLLEAGYHANHDSIEWLMHIIAGVPSETDLLNSLSYNDTWIRKDQMNAVLGRVVDLDRIAAQANPASGTEQLESAEASWATALLSEGKIEQARAVMAQVPRQQQWSGTWLSPEIQLAVADHSLPQMVIEWQKDGGTAPDPDALRTIAASLKAPARNIVMSYVYERALAARDFSAPNFLGLAAIRLDQNDTAGAMQLLGRMLLVSGDVYADMDSAASLLEEHHDASEAIEFLRPLSQASPWNAGYKVRLAAATLAVTPQSPRAIATLQAIVTDPKVDYSKRVAAAQALRGHGSGSALAANSELSLLVSSACLAPQEVSQPLYVTARMNGAACATSDAVREPLLRAALAAAPHNHALRLQYIWAAFGSGQNARALLAAGPIVHPWSYDGGNSDSSWGGDGYDAENQFASGSGSDSSWLTPSDAGRLYLLVVQALERQQQTGKALLAARRGVARSAGTPQQAALKAEQKRLMAITARQQQNNFHAPTIHAPLEQNHVVRPRIAAAAITAKEATQ